MNISFCDLKNKPVVNMKNGMRLGCVDDLCIDSCSAVISSLIIFGRLKWFGLLGRDDDIIICWDEIEIIGEDTILVCLKHNFTNKRKRINLIKKFFS